MSELPLLIGPGAGETERLILIGAPDGKGMVHLRTWTADDWAAPPRARDERAEGLLAWTETQRRAGRTMNQSPSALRRWLRGEGTGSGSPST
jgi:hypothetical protein